MPLALPFAHLNLKINPFGELRRETRAQLSVVDIDHLEPLLKQEGQAIQFVGPHGHGKSTRLLSLHARFPECPYTQFHPDNFPEVNQSPIQFLDSFDLLPARQRSKILKLSGSVAFTAHQSLEKELHKHNFKVTTVMVTENSTDTLNKIFEARIEYARRGPGPVPRISMSEIKKLQNRFGHDVRAMEHHLYDIFQDMTEVSDAQV